MDYPKTGNETYVSFSISNTMLEGLGKSTITREPVSADCSQNTVLSSLSSPSSSLSSAG